MTNVEALREVVRLALLTVDRSKREQKALLSVARRVDREWNVQSITNPRMKWPADQCTYPSEHDKTCVCRGSGMSSEPHGGWSLLEAEAIETWDPS